MTKKLDKSQPQHPVEEGGNAELERDGDDLYLVCGGCRVAKRKNGRWVQFEGGPPVTDISGETFN
jgi:hypothetical protein